jgi:Neprosin/Neprosin activation peptide
MNKISSRHSWVLLRLANRPFLSRTGIKKVTLWCVSFALVAAFSQTSVLAEPVLNQGDAKPSGTSSDEVRLKDPAEIAKVQEYLKNRLDRSTIRRVLKTASGRGVDCVDINAQPALKNNPALRNQPIQLAPRNAQLGSQAQPKPSSTSLKNAFEPLLDQSSSVQVSGCPSGTVPILEVTAKDLSRFASLQDFFAKVPSHLGKAQAPQTSLQTPEHQGPTDNHQYAHAYRFVTNWGASSNINLWAPYTELNNEFSLSQIWVVGGSGSGLQTLEVGSQKYYDLYSNSSAHLFIYSTRGNYAPNTGCYNNTCGDFVQVSSSVYPGAPFSVSSVYDGAQYEAPVQWFKDMDGGDWWLQYNGQWIGYYPRALYNTAGVMNHATEIDFGGEIIDNQNLNLHTSTDMGSGQFPSAWFGKAAYQRLLKYNYTTTTNPNTVWYTDVTDLTPTRSDSACYDIAYYTGDPSWRTYFFLGGPGYDYNNCR